MLLGHSAYAASTTWNNTGTDFNSAGSWTAGVPGNTNLGTADFNAAKVTNPNLSASFTTGHLDFSVSGASGYDLTSSSISVKLTLLGTTTGTGAAIHSLISSGTNTIDAPIVLGAASGEQTFNQSAGGTLIVNGVVSSTNTVGISFRGIGGGTIQLNGANTFSGGSSIDAGGETLVLGNDSALGTGGLTISAASTIQGGGGARSISNTLALSVGGLTISGANNLTLSGVVSGGSALTMSGSGTLTLSNTGDTYSGQLTVQAGTLSIGTINNDSANGELGNNSLSVILGNTGSSTGTLEYTGGTASSTKKFTMATGGTGAFQIDTAGTTLTLSGVIDGSGALNKTGAGTMILSGANTYTGATTVNAGSLFANNASGSGTGTGTVTVNNTGTLGGGNSTPVGGISGAVTVASGGNLSPGQTGVGSTAILKTGALTLNSGSNFNVDINGTTAGSGYDQVSVMGSVTVTLANLVVIAGSGLSIGNKFFIVLNDASDPVVGTFSGLAQGATVNASNNGDMFTISYIDNGDSGTVGNDISLTVTAIPEPSTWIAAALVLGVLAFTQRRRFARALKCVA